MKTVLWFLITICVSHCENQSFKRDTRSAAPDQNRGQSAQPATQATDVVADAGLPTPVPTIDPVDCKEVIVENPDEVLAISGFFPGRDFLNENCKTGISTNWSDQGAVRVDAATLKQLCYLMGFNEVASHGSRQWHSDGDNHMTWYDPNQEAFVTVYPTPSKTWWIHNSLVCKGKIYKKCENQQPIKCIKQ